MKRVKIFTIIATLALSLLVGGVSAKGRVDLSTEWGVSAGVSYPISNFDVGDSSASLSTKLGFSATAHMTLNIGKVFSIQPEVVYQYSKISVSDSAADFTTDIKCNTLQMPILFMARISAVRIFAGPVITIMDDPWYADRNGEKALFGSVYPTFCYTVGIGVRLFNRLLIDARFTSRFNPTNNFLSYDASSKGYDIKSTIHHAQLKVGVLF